MNTDMVRMNITLPKELIAALNKVAGPRERSRFIMESVRERIAHYEKLELQRCLAEGYQATAKEGLAITKEFEEVDLEGWDEY